MSGTWAHSPLPWRNISHLSRTTFKRRDPDKHRAHTPHASKLYLNIFCAWKVSSTKPESWKICVYKVRTLEKLGSVFHTLLQPNELFSQGSTWCISDTLKYFLKLNGPFVGFISSSVFHKDKRTISVKYKHQGRFYSYIQLHRRVGT